ncbi:8419_t:CDS:2 [Gigaspora margarita]|uniref:8419_t:CDS:1 n=1 Tax=Gigaspora margarita TaxID=4874 RepID=A0ABN7WAR8_GIGMA|nr:8419_t:CDS:2 [Gigaspora margarita]
MQGLYNKNQEKILNSLKEYSIFILERDRKATTFLGIAFSKMVTIIRKILETLEWFNFKALQSNIGIIEEQEKDIVQILINEKVLDLNLNKLIKQIEKFIEEIGSISSQKAQTKENLARKFILIVTKTTSLDYGMEHIA